MGDYIDAGFSRSGGFLATPIPEPSTLTLFSIGLLGMLCYARHAERRADA
ncbi:MAG: PEP-CTERM sorting domain-containing protein [Planctomycetaceae bacterium]